MSDEKTSPIVSNETPDVKLSARRQKLLRKANTLPDGAGCYLMKNQLGAIIYVGKAKNLKKRVKSYFDKSTKTPKTLILIGHIRDFEFMLTNSEAESYVLENNLIKEHRPKYNIRLKDDKSYPYIKINYNDDFPKLEYVRRPKRSSKVELYGPYPVGSNISNIMRIITKTYSLRDCSKHEFNNRETPCILYQMKQCTAPCVGLISKDKYLKDLGSALNILGSHRKFKKEINVLTEKMHGLADRELFEQAANLRDFISELEAFGQKSFDQTVENLGDKNTDIVAFHIGKEEVDISLYLIRSGNLLGQKNFHFLLDDFLDEQQAEITRALLQYYSDSEDILPDKVVTNLDKGHAENLQNALDEIYPNLKFKVQSETKKYAPLVKAAIEHAKESGRVRAANEDSVYVGLNRLKELLKLKDRPKTLECYDIAIWQGKSPTAAKIPFYEGKPDKKNYRHYHLEERPEGNNDFAMMKEVFARRLKRGELPDVFIVDGGIGQVNSAKAVLDELGLEVPIVGIAKAKEISGVSFSKAELKHSDERLIIPRRSNPYILNKCPSLMKIVVQMRDEAHRFSRRLHHKAEHKRVLTSWVDNLKGIPENIKKDILRINTLSLSELAQMNINDLQNFLGLSPKHARIIFDYLHAEEKINLKRG